MVNKSIKIVLMGLDGMPPELLRLILEDQGRKIKYLNYMHTSYGIYKLKSTIPYISPAAWTSMFSGVTPLKHGIFDFIKLIKVRNSYAIELTSLNDVNYPMLWNHLSKNKIKSIIANIPTFYPAQRLYGVMVSGPPNISLSTFPKHVRYILKSKFNYRVDVEEVGLSFKSNKVKVLNSIKEIELNHIKAFNYLQKNFRWQFLAYGFMFTDNILHFSIDKIYEYFNGELKDPPLEYTFIVNIMIEIDKLIQELTRKSDIIFLVSDHGMKIFEKAFAINSWFLNTNYLRLKKRGFINIMPLLNNKFIIKVYQTLRKITPIPRIAKKITKKLAGDLFDPSYIILEDSIVFAYNTNMPVALIKLVKKDLEIAFIKKELSASLQKILGNDVNVYTLNDIYNINPEHIKKVNKDSLPDILVVSNSYVFSSNILSYDFIFRPSRPGDHSPFGVFSYMSKKDRHLGNLSLSSPQIIDITPTILDLFEVHPEVTLDGVPLC